MNLLGSASAVSDGNEKAALVSQDDSSLVPATAQRVPAARTVATAAARASLDESDCCEFAEVERALACDLAFLLMRNNPLRPRIRARAATHELMADET